MHSIIRAGQFRGQLHSQFSQKPEAAASFRRPAALAAAMPSHHDLYPAHAGPSTSRMPHRADPSRHLHRQAWERRQLAKMGPNDGRIDVCRLIVATLGLALYLAIPIAAVSVAYKAFFG